MRPASGSSSLRPSKERLNNIVSLLNYSISAAALNIFGTEAPHVFLEVGRVALDKLQQEGVVFTGKTPLETINNIYSYFTSHGYFKAATATELTEKKTANGPCLVELGESWIKDCHISCPVKNGGKPGSHTCFCYNVMRYALWRDFSMELQFLESARGKKDGDIVIKAALVLVDKEGLKSWHLMDEIARREVMLTQKIAEMERLIRHMVGRELRMEELRKEIRLLKEAGAARPKGAQ